MPPESENAPFASNITKAKEALSSADREIPELQAVLLRFNHEALHGIGAVSSIITTNAARNNLHKLSRMVCNLEGSYVAHAVALADSADDARKAVRLNVWISVAYLCIAAGKVVDVIASVTGQGKWITSAKSSILDVAGAVQDEVDVAYWGKPADSAFEKKREDNKFLVPAAGYSLALLAAKERELFDAAKELQILWSSLIDVLKDFRELLSTPKDLEKLNKDLGPWMAKLAEKFAKLDNAVGKFKKLQETFFATKTPGKYKITGSKAAFERQASDWLSAVQYGLEAVVSFYRTVVAAHDTLESWKAWKDADARAMHQLTPLGVGSLSPDMTAIAGFSEADLLRIVQPIGSAADAHELAGQSIDKLRQLNAEANKLHADYGATSQKLASLTVEVTVRLSKLSKTDRELAVLREALNGQRDVDPILASLNLDLIDKTRKRIAGVARAP